MSSWDSADMVSATRDKALESDASTRTTKRLAFVYLAVFGGYTGQQVLTPVLPPLARELSLTEFQLGVVMSTSAAMVALTSTAWGRRSDTWGRKPLFTGALIGTTVGLTGFAITANLALLGALSSSVVFVAFLLTRGVVFGGALAALPVAARSYVADVTTGQKERVKGMSRVGASLGLGLVLGPAIGGLIGRFGLLTALYAAPLVLALMAILMMVGLPKETRHATRMKASKIRALDSRMWPFLLMGFAIQLSVSLLTMSIGFLIQDRLHLGADQTAEASGLVLLAGGLPMLLVQGFIVPKLAWSPLALLRFGLPLTGLAFTGMVFASNIASIIFAATLSGIGHSLAMPGYNSAPSLLFGPNEQGGVAGLIGSANAITLIIGPMVATGLYQFAPSSPFVVGAAVLFAASLFCLLYPGLYQSRLDGVGGR
ncbi:MFS transporter [Nocardia sp. NPDC052566]|uniref:MFS transporter n=1 Tax=Nocardia sp. NPDC052566 TaxID=3364330 RepID=UPI0037C56A06